MGLTWFTTLQNFLLDSSFLVAGNVFIPLGIMHVKAAAWPFDSSCRAIEVRLGVVLAAVTVKVGAPVIPGERRLVQRPKLRHVLGLGCGAS